MKPGAALAAVVATAALGTAAAISGVGMQLAPAAAAPRAPAATVIGATTVIGAATMTVTGLDPVELKPDGTVTITGTFTAAVDQPLTDVSVVVRRTTTRVAGGADIDEWLAPPPDAELPRLRDVVDVPLSPPDPATPPDPNAPPDPDVPPGPLAAGSTVPFTVSVDAAAVGLRRSLAAAGPYGITVDIVGSTVDATGAATDPPDVITSQRGFVIWSPGLAIPEVQLGIVTPLPTMDASPITGLVDIAQLDREAGSRGAFMPALVAAQALPGTWLVDPMLLASASVESAGPSTQDWLRDLATRRGDHEVILDTWGRPDPELLADSGLDASLRDLLGRVTADPGPGLDADGPFGPAPGPAVTVAPQGMGPDGLASLAQAGQAVVISSAAVPLVDPELPYTPTLREDIGTAAGPVRGLLTDPTLDTAMSGALHGGPLVRSALLAQLAAIRVERPGEQRTVGILVAEPATADPEAAVAIGAALTSSDWVAPITLAEWLAVEPAGLPRSLPPPPDPVFADASAADVPDLLATHAALADLSRAVDQPGQQLTEVALDRRTASAMAASVANVQELSRQFERQVAGWQAGVHIVQGSSLTLAASQGEIKVIVVNEVDRDVSLRLDVVSRSPRLRISRPPDLVTVPAGQQVAVRVPVQAVSNGRAQVIVRLVTPAGATWGEPSELDVRVAASFETGALTVVTVLIAGAFAIGTVRTVQRSRRRRSAPTRIAQ